MAHAAIYFEDNDQVPGGVDVKFAPTGAFQKDNPAHAMAWKCITEYLDKQANFKQETENTLEDQPSTLITMDHPRVFPGCGLT